MRNHPLLIVIALTVLLGCSTVKTQISSSNLPEQMPDGLVVKYSEDHGMSPSWFQIEIKNDELMVRKKKASEDLEQVRFVTLSNDEQAAIYKIFRDNRFDLIENTKPEDIAYDAGGDSIRIRIGKISHRVSSGMNSPIASGMGTNYRAVKKALKDLVRRKDSQLIDFPQNAVQFPYRKKDHGEIIPNGVRFSPTLLQLQKAYAAAVEELKRNNKYEYQPDGLLMQLVPYKVDQDIKIMATGFNGTAKKNFKRNPVSKEMTEAKIFRVFLDLPEMTVTKVETK